MLPDTVWAVLLALVILCVPVAVLMPRRGLLAWSRRFREARRRALAEDALKHLHNAEWSGKPATVEELAGALGLSHDAAVRLVLRMQEAGWVQSAVPRLHLTPAGERIALQIIRAHRLWEQYLVHEARMPLPSVHAAAHRLEHWSSPEALDALEAAMGHPAVDPHGDPIPNARGEMPGPAGRPITEWPLKTLARVVHVEDEPAAVFAQLVAAGVRPGKLLRVIAADERRLILSDGQDTIPLAPVVAANVFVDAAPEELASTRLRRLSDLASGEQAVVSAIEPALQGFTRRRLLDLGLTPGAVVTRETASLFGDPVAYRVRGSLIALRREQARHVIIAEASGKEAA